LDAVRDYFGVKIALYFAWLGFYTNLLIAPSIVGLLTFLYGVISLNSDVPRYVSPMEQRALKNVNNYLNTNIYFFLRDIWWSKF
jgi:Calcium-activated chloride channel